VTCSLIEREGVTHSTTVTTPLLKTGARQWLVVALGLRPLRTDRIILRIDDPPRLEEADETNNVYVFPEWKKRHSSCDLLPVSRRPGPICRRPAGDAGLGLQKDTQAEPLTRSTASCWNLSL